MITRVQQFVQVFCVQLKTTLRCCGLLKLINYCGLPYVLRSSKKLVHHCGIGHHCNYFVSQLFLLSCVGSATGRSCFRHSLLFLTFYSQQVCTKCVPNVDNWLLLSPDTVSCPLSSSCSGFLLFFRYPRD
jgi:hypothetical protein